MKFNNSTKVTIWSAELDQLIAAKQFIETASHHKEGIEFEDCQDYEISTVVTISYESIEKLTTLFYYFGKEVQKKAIV